MNNLQSLADPPFKRKQKNLWFDPKADRRWAAYIVEQRKREAARIRYWLEKKR
jgi:hypothetical protein